jgi:hypothetical protein
MGLLHGSLLPGNGGEVIGYRTPILSDRAAFAENEGNQGKIVAGKFISQFKDYRQ